MSLGPYNAQVYENSAPNIIYILHYIFVGFGAPPLPMCLVVGVMSSNCQGLAATTMGWSKDTTMLIILYYLAHCLSSMICVQLLIALDASHSGKNVGPVEMM